MKHGGKVNRFDIMPTPNYYEEVYEEVQILSDLNVNKKKGF